MTGRGLNANVEDRASDEILKDLNALFHVGENALFHVGENRENQNLKTCYFNS